jgi:hypothetical protein
VKLSKQPGDSGGKLPFVCALAIVVQLKYPPIQQMQPVAANPVESWFLVGGAFAAATALASTSEQLFDRIGGDVPEMCSD